MLPLCRRRRRRPPAMTSARPSDHPVEASANCPRWGADRLKRSDRRTVRQQIRANLAPPSDGIIRRGTGCRRSSRETTLPRQTTRFFAVRPAPTFRARSLGSKQIAAIKSQTRLGIRTKNDLRAQRNTIAFLGESLSESRRTNTKSEAEREKAREERSDPSPRREGAGATPEPGL